MVEFIVLLVLRQSLEQYTQFGRSLWRSKRKGALVRAGDEDEHEHEEKEENSEKLGTGVAFIPQICFSSRSFKQNSTCQPSVGRIASSSRGQCRDPSAKLWGNGYERNVNPERTLARCRVW